MKYGIFTGEYSDWEIVGYFDDRESADKYCALHKECYVEEINDMYNSDLSNVKIKYNYVVSFRKINKEWSLIYISNYFCHKLEEDIPYRIGGVFPDRVALTVSLSKPNEDKAKKIAQDYLSKLLSYGNGNFNRKACKLMNSKFKEMENKTDD